MLAEQFDFASEYAIRRARYDKAISDARAVVSTASAVTNDELLAEALRTSTLPELDQAQALTKGLRRTQDLAFGQHSEVGVGSAKLNRTTKRLISAVEDLSALEQIEREVVSTLVESFPGFIAENYADAARAIIVLSAWDKDPCALPPKIRAQSLGDKLLRSLSESDAIELLLFVCPPVEFGYLNSEEPERYLRTSMEQSLLSRRVKELAALSEGLEKVGVRAKLKVFIGDNDEDDYIFPVLGKPQELNTEALQLRRELLRQETLEYLSGKIKAFSGGNLDVISLSSYQGSARTEFIREEVVSQNSKFFSDEEVEAECRRMNELWEKGSYYDGIPTPSAEDLKSIVALKFGSYAMQGVLSYQENPNLLLIQTEMPSKLRTKMLNVGRETLGLDTLQAVYLNIG